MLDLIDRFRSVRRLNRQIWGNFLVRFGFSDNVDQV